MNKTHSLILTAILICVSLSGFSQNNPVAYAGPDRDICSGDTTLLQGIASGSGPNYTYQWSPNTNISDPTIANPLVWPTVDTDYILVVTSNNVTSAPDTCVVRSHPIPTVNAGADVDICLGDTAQLNAVGSGDPSAIYQFSWSPISSLNNPLIENPKAYPLQSTTYFVEIESLWGCIGQLDSVNVSILPTAQADAGTNMIVCIGDSFALNGGYYYTTTDTLPTSQISSAWSPASSVGNPSEFETNGYAANSLWMYLTVNAGVCTSVDSVFVTAFPRPMPVITQSGNTLNVTGGLGGGMYQWFINNVAIPGATNTLYNITQAGCYSVSITEGQCIGESDTLCVQQVGMEEWTAVRNIDAFPNPFQNEVRINFELLSPEELTISLVDLTGKVVKEVPATRFGTGTHLQQLDTEDLPQGMYWLRIRGKNGSTGMPLLHF